MENLPVRIHNKENLSKYMSSTAEDAEIVVDEPLKENPQTEKNSPASKESKKELSLEEKAKKAIEGINRADKLNSAILGKTVYHNFKKTKNRNGNGFQINQIPNDLAYETSKIQGYDSYASWNQQKGNFYIESENQEAIDKLFKQLNKKYPETNTAYPINKKGKVLFGEIKGLKETEFKKIILGDFNDKIRAGIKSNNFEPIKKLFEQLEKNAINKEKQEESNLINEIKKAREKVDSFDNENPDIRLEMIHEELKINRAKQEILKQEIEKLKKIIEGNK